MGCRHRHNTRIHRRGNQQLSDVIGSASDHVQGDSADAQSICVV
jgi:hypothetical protein